MKKVVILLFLTLLLYAANENTPFQKPRILEAGGVAIIFSAVILALLYMIGFGFNIQPMTIAAKDEFYHLLISIVLLGSFATIAAGLDGFIGKDGFWLQAFNKIAIDNVNKFKVVLGDINNYENVAIEGSKMATCQFFTASLTTTSCGGYSALAAPANTANSIISMVLVSYYALQTLLKLGMGAGINIILPLGVFFHCFKFTRPLGAILIAISFSLYVLLPLMILAMEEVYDRYTSNTIRSSSPPNTSIKECEPEDSIPTNEKKAVKIFDDMKKFLAYYMEIVLIKGFLFPIVYVLSLAAGIRGIAALAGVEVDVSAISRLM